MKTTAHRCTHRIDQNSFPWIIARGADLVARPGYVLKRDSSVTGLVRMHVGRLDGLIGNLGVSEVRSDEQTQTEQHDRKTEQGADQLARHTRRPGDGTCFNVFLQNFDFFHDCTLRSLGKHGKVCEKMTRDVSRFSLKLTVKNPDNL